MNQCIGEDQILHLIWFHSGSSLFLLGCHWWGTTYIRANHTDYRVCLCDS